MGDRDPGERRSRHGRRQVPESPRTPRRPRTSASASSPPRPRTKGSPHLRRTTRLPRAGGADQQPVDGLLLDRRATSALADGKAVRAPRELQRLGRHQRVVEDQVRLSQPAGGLEGEQVGIPGTRADQRDETAHGLTSVASAPLDAYRRFSARSRSGRRSPIGTPAARCSCRSRPGRDDPASMSSGTSASSPSRRSPASAGARPSVETAIVTPPRRKTPPAYALAPLASSTALTNTCRSRAAAATWRFTSGVAAATTNQASSRSRGTNCALDDDEAVERGDLGPDLGRHDRDAGSRAHELRQLRRRRRRRRRRAPPRDA